jgi:hypothetical protein
MKQIAWLFLAVLCSAILLNAEDNNGQRMNGWVCDSKCVVQNGGSATCSADCTERSGTSVFITDQGEVRQISNQDMCQSHVNKHVKARVSFPQDPSKSEMMRLEELQNDSGAN